MYTKIVCAIETSDEASTILTKAKQLAEMYQAELLVTHVIATGILPKNYQKELQENVSPKINAIALAHAIDNNNISIKFGKPYEQICTFAEQKAADLIVLGKHSKQGIDALIGSTANAITNNAPCDVLLLRV